MMRTGHRIEALLLFASTTIVTVGAGAPSYPLDAASDTMSCEDAMAARYNCSEPACAELADDSSLSINYLRLYECSSHGWIAVMIAGVTLLLMALGLTADEYFCPAIEGLVKELNLDANLAGVTLVAFGNGAPDVFGSIASFASGNPDLGISGLLGAGIFCTGPIVSAVTMVAPMRQLASRAFLRDVAFYIVAVFWLALLLFFTGGSSENTAATADNKHVFVGIGESVSS